MKGKTRLHAWVFLRPCQEGKKKEGEKGLLSRCALDGEGCFLLFYSACKKRKKEETTGHGVSRKGGRGAIFPFGSIIS